MLNTNTFKVFLIVVSITAFGCSDPVVDGSSDKARKVSIEKIKESLSAEQKVEFDDALKVLAGEVFVRALSGDKKAANFMKEVMDGKSAIQIIAKAKEIKEERSRKEDISKAKRAAEEKKREKAQKEQDRIRIADLRMKLRLWESAQQEFKQMIVTVEGLRPGENAMGQKRPIVKFILENKTSKAVARIETNAMYRTPGRKFPWAKGKISITIKGGLEPGEKKEVYQLLASGYSDDWVNLELKSDAKLEVEIVDIQDDKMDTLFPDMITETEREELERLLKKKYSFN